MAEIHRERGFTFHVLSNDHQPAHIHIKKSGGEIKVDISDKNEVVLLDIKSEMKNKDINRALDIAEANLEKFRLK
ncbi:MAG: DUF4160 domain-containing protein, partial [Cyanobacteria bacterium J06643_4]